MDRGRTAVFPILDELVAQNRQGILALGGDCYLHWKGQRVLVKAPNPDDC